MFGVAVSVAALHSFRPFLLVLVVLLLGHYLFRPHRIRRNPFRKSGLDTQRNETNKRESRKQNDIKTLLY